MASPNANLNNGGNETVISSEFQFKASGHTVFSENPAKVNLKGVVGLDKEKDIYIYIYIYIYIMDVDSINSILLSRFVNLEKDQRRS